MIYSIIIKLTFVYAYCFFWYFLSGAKERTQIQQTFNYMKLDLVTVRSFKNIQNNWF